ncbi:ribbon-helix-helix domain-containing protein [Haladaptatus sp. GCM10025707]|uniref:ribbon-helix-helix domain-containing protein n=1 Tax=Haladaptatus sp. GCM10025707 TaxID=3252658 RepID=UPI00360D5D88
MSSDGNSGSDGEMEKINVRVPRALLTQIDEVWEQRGYANKSEFIRYALRDAVTLQHSSLRKHSSTSPKAVNSGSKARRSHTRM